MDSPRSVDPTSQHVSLYRKWRPRTFDAVAGQEPVVRTLKRAMETGRVAHAYLFSGPRGTGKTSTAKVLAMGLNCEKGPTPTPDGTCAACRAVVGNTSMDVLEMDAASNRGIDEIRDLRDKVHLAPTQGRTKVYIIDEVHMLTTEAFNALLKMLEEPPEQVVFVLATTEKHKVPATIISRCQSFDFRRPGVALLAEKLKEISDAEGIEAEPAALTLIAREGRGSFRDAEGLLDQLSSFADGGPITASLVRELLGSAGAEVLIQTVDALHEKKAADALRVVDRLSNEGRDLSRFVQELVGHLRRLMLLPHAPEIALSEVGEEERAPLEEQAGRVTTAWVVRGIVALDGALARTRRGGDAKLELELTFLGLTRDYVEPSVDALLERIEALEGVLQNGVATGATSRRPSTSTASPTSPGAALPEPIGLAEVYTLVSVEDEEEPEEAESPAPTPRASGAEQEAKEARTGGGNDADGGQTARSEPEESVAVASPTATEMPDWSLVMAELKKRRKALTAAVYAEARVGGFDGETLTLVYPEEQAFHVGMARDAKHTDELGKILEERLGTRPRLEFEVAGVGGSGAANGDDDGRGGTPGALRDISEDRQPVAAEADLRPEPRPVPESRRIGSPEPEARSAVEAQMDDDDDGGPAGPGTFDGGAAVAGPSSGGGSGGERLEGNGAGNIVGSSREVFEMARERFGGARSGGS